MKSDEIAKTKCPTCGRTMLKRKPIRVCANCKQPILKDHKYKYEPLDDIGIFKLVHWDCKAPESYGPKYK